MIRAVDQRDRDIDDRITLGPLLHRVLHAGLDRGNPLARDGAPGDLVDELKALAARQGLHLDDAIAELAVSAGLLLVTAALFSALADCFLVGRRWTSGGDLNAETRLQPIDHGAQVRVALPLQQ